MRSPTEFADQRQSTGYRASLPLPHGTDAIKLAQRHVQQWLRQKLDGSVVDAWDGQGSHSFDEQFSIDVVERDDGQSGDRRRLYRLTDRNSHGTFQISLFALDLRNGKQAHLIVEGAAEPVRRRDPLDAVATPNIVREVLDDVEVIDGRTRLTGTPQVVHVDEVINLVNAITDPERHGAVIVASSPGAQVDPHWTEIIRKLTRNSVGVAATFVVLAEAVDVLNAALPASHAVPPGNVRTFMVSVDLDSTADGLAHRFLGPSTLARAVSGTRVRDELVVVHARAPRKRVLNRGVPGALRRAMELLEAQEQKDRLHREAEQRDAAASRDSSRQMPSVPGTVELGTGDGVAGTVVEGVRGLLERWLDIPIADAGSVQNLDRFIKRISQDAAVATEYAELMEAEKNELAMQVQQLREALDERDFEIAATAEEYRRADRENRYLRGRLHTLNEFPNVAEADEAAWAGPSDIDELIAWITPGKKSHRALARVEFTGDPAVASEVRKRDGFGKYAQDLWDYVRVLYEYAEQRARGIFDGNVHMYLTADDVDTFRCTPQRHAGRESDSVLNNSRWRSERTFPVPEEVDPLGLTLMDAHFKPTHRDQFAPRMHYFDDTANTGKVYVGYIGRHLTNTKS